MKLSTIASDILDALDFISTQAKHIQFCCVFTKKKYKLKTRLCTRCQQRLQSIVNKTTHQTRR